MERARGLINLLVGIVILLTCSAAAYANDLNGVRVWPSPDSTRVVLDLSEQPSYKYFSLTNPHRLVVDLKQTANQVDLSKIKLDSKLVKKIRTSKPPEKGTLRLVLELSRPVKPVLFPLSPTKPYGDRLVIDAFDTREPAKAINASEKVSQDRDVIIAIDAGHGGEDPGSIGPGKRFEKRITLQIAKRLANYINQQKGMKATMVRTGDYYVNLNRRSEIARKRQADLLISVHADAFTSPQPRGASVWVLSQGRANSEIGRWMEQTEKHSELLGGAAEVIENTSSEKYVARALLDMSMDRSMVESQEVAARIVKEMGKVTKLHKKKPVAASLAVLKSPDIPSILVETGFISNPTEAKLLSTPSHQDKLALAIFRGTRDYFKQYPPHGSYLARNKSRQHVVQRGESLSLIASRYNTSVSKLKKENKLKSDVVRIGQVLRIPGSSS
ncbi:N-acetylmuramoyl-L-alanine amidase [Neiella sp. HB171785]|uniref:N-acetylmuramoyl-L-alanine amidase AmiC n=1 Tax=Neiella litorisoli TaxID=2771431 RepID=A0A8J6QJA0_9GAMM|nr:N-acetylmuramoyl-L-alanine amidase [Neiella litorisoli]MBD1390023.1 N-acetylmuramoyl-L-alanine amidase [Neiella litorisoli]